MKLYRLLYRIFSYLSDKTNGFSFFVKYKLVLGTLIIGAANSCSDNKEIKHITISKGDKKDIDTTLVTCYVNNNEDSVVDLIEPVQPVFIDSIIMCYEPFISCYIIVEEPIVDTIVEDIKYHYSTIEHNPLFQDKDLQAFQEWVLERSVLPDSLMADTLNKKLRMIVNFTVNKNGKVEDINILRGIEATFDNEVKNIILSSPTWTPGEHNGKTVDVIISLPLNYENNKRIIFDE